MGKRGIPEVVLPEETRNRIEYMFFEEHQSQVDIIKILGISKYQVLKVINQIRKGCKNASELGLLYLNNRGFDSWWQYRVFLELKDDYKECFLQINGQLKDPGYDIKVTQGKEGIIGIKFLEEIEYNGFVINVFRKCLDNARNAVSQIGFPVKGELRTYYTQNVNSTKLRIRPTGLEARAFLSAYGDVLKG